MKDGGGSPHQGVVGGAILGALAGALVAKSDSGQVFATGVAIGGIAGYAYGNHVARKKSAYVNEEKWMDVCMTKAKVSLRYAKEYNARLKTRISSLDAAREGDSRLSRNDAELESRLAKNNIHFLSEEIRLQQDAFKQISSSGISMKARLARMIETLKTEREQMEESADILFTSGSPSRGLLKKLGFISVPRFRQDVPDPDIINNKLTNEKF